VRNVGLDIYELFLEEYVKHMRPSPDIDVYHVTEACGCVRRAYYARTRPQQYDKQKVVVLSIGQLVHRMLQNALREKGFEIEKEVEIDLDGYKLVGHIDAYDGRFVHEFKTVKAIPNAVYVNHYLQTKTYLAMVGAKTGYVYYIDRNYGIVEVYTVKNNEQKIPASVRKNVELLRNALKNNEPPTAKPSWLCQYCEYAHICGVSELRDGLYRSLGNWMRGEAK